MLFRLLFTQLFCYPTILNHNGNEAILFFCIIPAISPNVEYIKIQVESFLFINLYEL